MSRSDGVLNKLVQRKRAPSGKLETDFCEFLKKYSFSAILIAFEIKNGYLQKTVKTLLNTTC